jgi:hypothetical protein
MALCAPHGSAWQRHQRLKQESGRFLKKAAQKLFVMLGRRR